VKLWFSVETLDVVPSSSSFLSRLKLILSRNRSTTLSLRAFAS
jgi:hypothetical protein